MRISKRRLFSILAIAALAISLVSAVMAHADEDDQNDQQQTRTVLHDINGAEVGEAHFEQDDNHVEVQVQVHDLPPGFHGFHVHSVGICDPTPVNGVHFASAKGHLALHPGQTHPHHSGDLPSLLVNEDGTGEAKMVTDRFTITDLLNPNSSLIVHADPDNFANIPVRYRTSGTTTAPIDAKTNATGDSGNRIACGVIQMENSDEDAAQTMTASMLQVLMTVLDSIKTLGLQLTFSKTFLPF